MTKIMTQTLIDLKEMNYLLTRFSPASLSPDDFDILIHPKDFKECIQLLKTKGYQSFSHDFALGGRIPGMQINLVKANRIKIDLHKDFTWRKTRYLDVEKIWQNSIQNRVDPTWDAFLIMVNVIFEKTYFVPDDFDMFFSQWQKIKNSPELLQQTFRYSWNNTFTSFKKWIDNQTKKPNFPLFLPMKLVLSSYFDKFDFVSLVYYFFFRFRYFINNNLPYEKKL